jgi:hypothetical protein
MQLTLTRTYTKGSGTDGLLHLDGFAICFTIELPWLENQPNISCIPEGRYTLVKRQSKKHDYPHLLVQNVLNRSYILIHRANNALRQLRGCIAPVEELTDKGCGDNSTKALSRVMKVVQEAFDRQEPVTLLIQSLK